MNGNTIAAWDQAAIDLVNKKRPSPQGRYTSKEAHLARTLRRQIAVQRRQTIPVQTELDWKEFCEQCALSGERARPAAPAIVAEHLMCTAKSAAEAERISASISHFHRIWRAPTISEDGWVAEQAPDPTTDILVLSAIRFFHDCEAEEKAELERLSAATKANKASKKEAKK